MTDGGDGGGGRGPSAPFQDRLQWKFALPREDDWYLYGAEQGRACPQEQRPRTPAEINRPASLGQPLPAAARYVPSWAGCGPFPPQTILWSGRPTCRHGVHEQPVPAADGREESEVGDYLTLLFSLLMLPSSILQVQGWKQPCSHSLGVGTLHISWGVGTLHISRAGSLYSAPTFARSLFCWTLTNIPRFANEETEAQRGSGLAVSHPVNVWQGWLQNSCLLTMSNKICPPAHSVYSVLILRFGVMPNHSAHLGRGGVGILGGTCHRR